MRRLVEISDPDGVRLLSKLSSFSLFPGTRADSQLEYSGEPAPVQEMITSERKNILRKRVEQLNGDPTRATT